MTQPAGADLWFLDRLDEVSWASQDNTYDMCPIGGHDDPASSSVVAYVLDFPVWRDHAAFAGRVTLNVNCALTSGCQVDTTPSPGNACRGVQNGNVWTNEANWKVLDHGTNVASLLTGSATIAGTYNTGAARPEVISVQAISCEAAAQSRFSFYLNSLNYIWNHWYFYRRNKAALVNHSGFFYPWLHNYAYARDTDGNLIIENNEPVIVQSEDHRSPTTGYSAKVREFVTGSNIPYFTSADNWGADACQFSPNDLAYTGGTSNGVAFVVGGTQKPSATTDVRWSGGTDQLGLPFASNSGPCVSAWAPASNMWVATHETSGVVSTTAYEGNAGTSFSAPLAAGIAARYMEERFNTFQGRPTYKEVYDYLLQENASSPTPPSNGTTGYPVCVEFGTGIHRKATEAEASSGICDSRAQYHFIQGAPHSNARMIHWNRTCP